MKPSYRHVRTQPRQGALVMTLLDMQIRGDEMADSVGEEMRAAVDDAGICLVAVDMLNVSYMSTVGFRPLLRLQKHVKEKGGRIVLCNLHPIVNETMEVTRLVSTIRTFPAPFERQADVEAALASLLNPKPAQ